MSEKKPSDYVFGVVNSEGLGYALTGYLGPRGDEFEDEELGRLWNAAYDALNELEAYMDEIGYEPQ